jgi:hypothetical protein
MLLLCSRNVTITGKPGVLPVLDLAFTNELLELCHTCWLTIQGVVLTRARRGSGDGVQAVVGGERLGAVLLLQDVIRQRIACVPAADAAAVVAETPRSAFVPSIAPGQQSAQLGNIQYKVSSEQSRCPSAASRDNTCATGLPMGSQQSLDSAWQVQVLLMCNSSDISGAPQQPLSKAQQPLHHLHVSSCVL